MVSKRTWQVPMDELAKTKRGATYVRWQCAIKDKAFNLIRDLPILETQAEHFLKVLDVGKVSTNVFLRRIHNFALDMGWLPWPVVVKRQWPAIEFKDKRAITWDEHCQIVEREKNPERKAFYKMAWHMGASQSDLAFLEAENIDWEHHVISFERKKTGSIAIMRFAEDVAEILRDLPGSGPLFPYLRTVRANDRAIAAQQLLHGCAAAGFNRHAQTGISLGLLTELFPALGTVLEPKLCDSLSCWIHDDDIVVITGPIETGVVRQFIPIFHRLSFRVYSRRVMPGRPQADTRAPRGAVFSQRLARSHPPPPVISV